MTEAARPTAARRFARQVAINVGLAVLYAAVGRLGLGLSTQVTDVTLVWPAAGLALAAVLRFGFGVLPGLAVGAALTNYLGGGKAIFVAATAIGNPLEAALAAVLLRRLGFEPSFGRLADPALHLAATIVAPLAAAAIGTWALVYSGMENPSRVPDVFFTWWLGDAMGLLIVTPVLLTWSVPAYRQLLRERARTALALLFTVISFSVLVYMEASLPELGVFLNFLFFPLILIGAARLGPVGAATTLLLVALAAVIGVYVGLGPFAEGGPDRGLLRLHGFLLSLALSGLVPAALMWERRLSARRLAESEERFRGLVMSMAEGIVLQDLTGAIVAANPQAEKILGLTWDQLRGVTSLDPRWGAIREDGSPFPGEEHPAMVTLRSGKPCRNVIMGVRRPDGTLSWISINSELVRDEEKGEPSGVVATFNDITEARRLQTMQVRAQRLESLGTLAGGLAHDLNNVLAPIRLGLGFLSDRLRDESSRSMLEVMEASLDRGASLVGQILTYVRGSRGDRTPVEVRPVMLEVERLVRRSFPANVELRLEMAEELPPILADATQIHQAILNLCVNARDAMPQGGVLTLSAQNVELSDETSGESPLTGSFVCIGVRDTGPGIPPAVRERVFDPFFTTKSAGTGLGLAIVQSIVKGHGGLVRLENAPDEGAFFQLYLPVAAGRSVEQGPATDSAGERGHGETLLVIEDDPGLRETVSRLLEYSGYRPLVAGDGRSGWELFQKHADEIHAVISDISLPGMDGRELLARVHELRPRVPFVAVSGLPQAGLEGAQAVLQKPYALAALLLEIRRALDRPSS